MRTFTFFLVIVSAFIFACKGSFPTSSDPITQEPTSQEPSFQNGFELISFEPAAGATLTKGDLLRIDYFYTANSATFWESIAFIRDDGEEYIDSSGSYLSPGRFKGGMSYTLNDRYAFYEFFRGHTVNAVFILGRAPIYGVTPKDLSGFVIWRNVVFEEKIKLNWRVE